MKNSFLTTASDSVPAEGRMTLERCRKYINEGYVCVVSMDLQSCFDTVNHSKLIEVLSRTVKDGRVISLIHRYLKAGVMEDGGFHAAAEGVPQV